MQVNSLLAKAVRFALIGGAATAALTAPVVLAADAEIADNVERIQVTGSRIKRTDMETATPVTVLSADDMAKQGFNNVQEALQSLTSTTSAMTTQSVHGFTPAASSISLRGAGANRTLTLINGKRLNQYPKPAGGTDNFVDTANLPMEAVARIEVLQSGGSAIYGADAVGGVINIILKRDFEGAAIKYRHGDTTEGGGANDRLTLSLGSSSERGNVSTFLEYSSDEQITASQREAFGLHTDLVPTSNFGSYSSYGARIAKYDDTKERYITADTLNEQDCGARGFKWTGSICGFDRSEYRDLSPESRRFSSITNFNYSLTDDMSFVGRLDVANAKSTTNIEPSAIDQDDMGISISGNSITLSDGTHSKTFADKSTAFGGDFSDFGDGKYGYVRRLHEIGNRVTETETNNYFFSSGLEGILADEYAWDASINYGRTDVKVFNGGATTYSKLFDMMSAGDGKSLYENLTNEEADAIHYTGFERSQSTQKNIQASIAGYAFELDAGDAQFAFGAEYTEQDYKVASDAETMAGNVVGKGGSSGQGDRSYWATFAELEIPIHEDVTINTALRYDRYSDFGGNFSPQLTVEYRPMGELLVRSSINSVFRAPDMHRVYGDATQGFNSVIDFKKCQEIGGTPGEGADNSPCNSLQVDTTVGANSELEAETGYTANIGAVWGGDQLNASIDLWEWKLDDMVSNLGASTIAQKYDIYEEYITRDTSGTITHINAQAQNLSYQQTRGLDITAGYSWDLANFGDLKLDFNGSLLLLSEGQSDPTAEVIDDLEDGGVPEYKANLILGWFYEDFETTIGAYHTARSKGIYYSAYKQSAEDNDLEFNGEDYEVASQTKWNLTAAYMISDAISVKGGVVNLFNAGPNFDPTYGAWPHYNRSIFNARGREWFVEGEVKF
ncbi:TonB-dependent receptor [Shewanella sp. KX20019]|uniref:TonB-dependent receptor plug domain-containing protein n=1 Tax=Shewanella sp. KX20019 TaxID=2803864 RepID=UPI001925AB27|nr:TonB-dependent receptor [Shewanella sp. KX20019]QQX78672.1 TonB-dependent receptor [Shewanella sp. KX20019]